VAVNDNSLLHDPSIIAKLLIALTTWMTDPAVMTAMASLLTALVAFWRSRHRRMTIEPVPPPVQQQQAPSLADAYSTLHEAEEKIREELLQQLQHLQEETERISDDLAHYRQAAATFEEAIIRCSQMHCPVRERLDAK